MARITLFSGRMGRSEFCINIDCPTNEQRLKEIAEAKANREAKGGGKGGRGKKRSSKD